jgi:hypothetical protein
VDTFGQFVGALIAEVNMKKMWDLVASLHIGKAGLVYVVDRKGNLPAEPDTEFEKY